MKHRNSVEKGQDVFLSLESLEERSKAFQEKCALYEQEVASQKARQQKQGKALENSRAVRLASEFISGIVVGIVLGLGFDYIFNTSPWGMIIFFILGFGASILNLLRFTGRVSASVFDKE